MTKEIGKGKVISFVREKGEPIIIAIAEELNKTNGKLKKHGYGIERFEVNLKGITRLPEINVSFKKIER